MKLDIHFSDETKYGQKMLEKMGWKKGKGLGANEDGMTNHLKVSLKNDKKGEFNIKILKCLFQISGKIAEP